ncbi:MAG: hypothetical protein J6W74_02915 [Bacteroidales bacterium]|nr:hypothetical protein [Bacteroidales bacterium]
MKESYHICYTSHGEVMFRDREDYGVFLNLAALRCYSTGSELLVDAEMSTHVHLNVFTDCPMRFGSALRMSYTKYFNHKYGRKGRLGEHGIFLQRISGFQHQVVAMNYIFRNGLHHGAAATAFGYSFCSVKEPFKEDIFGETDRVTYTSRTEIASIFPEHADFPDKYMLDYKGVILRSCFMETRRVEQFYVTPRNFLFQMNRLTDDSWIRDQEQDKTGSPIRLGDIEHDADENAIARMLKNESGRSFNKSALTDLSLCELIDKELAIRHGATSIYGLPETTRKRIAKELYHDRHLPMPQIKRCLALP